MLTLAKFSEDQLDELCYIVAGFVPSTRMVELDVGTRGALRALFCVEADKIATLYPRRMDGLSVDFANSNTVALQLGLPVLEVCPTRRMNMGCIPEAIYPMVVPPQAGLGPSGDRVVIRQEGIDQTGVVIGGNALVARSPVASPELVRSDTKLKRSLDIQHEEEDSVKKALCFVGSGVDATKVLKVGASPDPSSQAEPKSAGSTEDDTRGVLQSLAASASMMVASDTLSKISDMELEFSKKMAVMSQARTCAAAREFEPIGDGDIKL
jgi:hypothetical protein